MKVLLVEDHALFREGVSLILQRLDDNIEVIAAETATEAEAAVDAHSDLHLILLDYNLPDGTGLNCLANIRKGMPKVFVIMLSAEQDSQLIQKALSAGANGFITKTSSSSVMLSAIQLVLSGGLYVPPEMISGGTVPSPAVTSGTAPSSGSVGGGSHQLTNRQLDVLQEMLQGLSNKEIARNLNMSPSTVKVHVAAILKELNVKNRTQAVAYARENNIIQGN